MKTILIIEDDEAYRNKLSSILSTTFEVIQAQNGTEGLYMFKKYSNTIMCILLDLMLPDISGIELCYKVRERSNIPIIIQTAKNTDVNKVIGLEIGADDYIVKPYSSRELIARIHAVLRRFAQVHAKNYVVSPDKVYIDNNKNVSFKGIEINHKKMIICMNDHDTHMPLKEFELLYLLTQKAEQAVSRRQILDHIWNINNDNNSVNIQDTKTLDVHIKRIRSKIKDAFSGCKEEDIPKIMTIRKYGYKLI